MITDSDIQAHLDQLTKPPGSLGALERLAARLCRIQGTLSPRTRPRRLIVFAGDHGVVASGVSAWPSEVTGAMIRNIASGGAASSVLARSVQAELHLVDAGSMGPPVAEAPGVRVARIGQGTADLSKGPAMSPEELEAALELGSQVALEAVRDGMRIVLAGEMGIGNTTSASCLAALLGEVPLEEAVGRGAGADDEVLARKHEIVRRAVERERPVLAKEPRRALAAVCGHEIGAMAGFFLAAHGSGLTILLDGMIATSAALLAAHIDPSVPSSMIAAHRSVEPAHRYALEHLGLEPFLDWQLRLGEGTGALLLLPLLDAAAAMVAEMATFEDLGLG